MVGSDQPIDTDPSLLLNLQLQDSNELEVEENEPSVGPSLETVIERDTAPEALPQRPLTSEEILNQEIALAFSRAGAADRNVEDDWHIDLGNGQGSQSGHEAEPSKIVSIDQPLQSEQTEIPPLSTSQSIKPQTRPSTARNGNLPQDQSSAPQAVEKEKAPLEKQGTGTGDV
ncbi:hypothetical protein HDU91_005900 [Kappamyces sp. JEL0680]|nr:hypothetical protein HDU91_005900 [Kappamyces sp. JEL0680]